ncbi:MAG: TonB-dependent receptor [Gammaproteobacteria bacterium]|nr:TonB-dependent receptor [Gammaproteobacteria bacterium]
MKSSLSLLLSLSVAGYSTSLLSNSDLVDSDLLDSDPFESLLDEELPLVLSATRLKQPKAEAPASVTVIDQKTIKQLGIRSLAEVFRLVPGMTVGYERGHTPEVGYHSLGGENSRHLQVLVDGRSIYQPALARILWTDLPLALDKISRIEVIRGSNTALYGANSYLAVINIITFHPEDMLGHTGSITRGNHGIGDAQLSFRNTDDNFAVDITFGHNSDDGFEETEGGTPRIDGYQRNYISSDLVWHQNDNDFIRFQFGLSDSSKQVDDIDPNETTPFHLVDVSNSFLQLTSQHFLSAKHEVKLQAFATNTEIKEDWQTCSPALFLSEELYDLFELSPTYTDGVFLPALPNLPPSSGDPDIDAQALLVLDRLSQGGDQIVCGFANQDIDEQRLDFEAQWTGQLSSDTRIVAGLNYRRDKSSSESYFGGQSTKDIWRSFGHLEWQPASHLRVNIGAMLEDDSLIGSVFSPRLAVNWLVENNQSFRLIYSEANRSPDLFEEDNNRSYLIRNTTDLLGQPVEVNNQGTDSLYYQHASAPGGLDFEQITSWEAGWFYKNLSSGIELDIKYFRDALTDILEGRALITGNTLSNDGEVDLKGLELQLNWDISTKLRFWSTASKIDAYNNSLNFYRRSAPKSTFTFNSFYQLSDISSFTLSYYQYDEWFRVDFERVDASFGHTFMFGDYQLDTTLAIQHRLDDNYLLDDRNVYQDQNKIYAKATLKF